MICIGILAHVDAGKTTLSEALLYETGSIKKLGRVDKRDTFLDTDEIEKKRGITVFSKQAEFVHNDIKFTLIDTPGHVDFSAEMERSLQVLDYAILVISASEGIQSHTMTLWKLLKIYNIPVFTFVNKMDMPDVSRDDLLSQLRSRLSEYFVDFTDDIFSPENQELAAMSDEKYLDIFLEENKLSQDAYKDLIARRKIFPCCFGSALKLDLVKQFADILSGFVSEPVYSSEDFSARVYKVSRDEQGNRLTHVKITGGSLLVRGLINDEKVSQIRIYSGEKYTTVNEVFAGQVCTLLGLENTNAGDTIGDDNSRNITPVIEPVIRYTMILPEGIDARAIFNDIAKLEEEIPEIALFWHEDTKQIAVKIMGQVQLEVLSTLINKRLGFVPGFDKGKIEYKETIKDTVIGVGHFEPLRHYAEVHIKIEPGEIGSGICYDVDVSTDILAKNWQRLIISGLKSKLHRGILTNSPLTDVKITLINGRAHDKHTVGGDFRQASHRAVRQGLMKAESVLLEPYYDFSIEVPLSMLGRVMTDLDTMKCSVNPPETTDDRAFLSGYGPVYTLREYQENISAYTKGLGVISCSVKGFLPCHNEEEVVCKIGYNPDSDLNNLSSSVFCAHGAGFIVPWYEVEKYMHVFDDDRENISNDYEVPVIARESFDYAIGTEEIDEIIDRASNSNKSKAKKPYKKTVTKLEYNSYVSSKPKKILPKMLIVDGYNVIFAIKELKYLSDSNLNAAKDKLINIMSTYKSITDYEVMVIFDGYKQKGNVGSKETIEGVLVIHTKDGETADLYIEKFTNDNISCYNITVVSSDGLIQQITRGHNCNVISSREFESIYSKEQEKFREQYNL